jgi:conjugal transfer pilus assembly protein TraB
VIPSVEPRAEGNGVSTESEALGASSELPTGSIISGVLVTGMDAPTGQDGRRDPFPALLRVKAEAVLPNRVRADIRECFILMSGYGDLSSERAYLRGESLSCVREDGAVIEASIRGFAVGSDGKAGVRGRVVSKQGQLIARSLLAGFADGVSNAFNLTNVPVISTDPTDRIQWQERMSSDSLQAATLTGAGRAMERIADYYLEMAEGMYPVIEIDAGREIEFVLNGGLRLVSARNEVRVAQRDREGDDQSE